MDGIQPYTNPNSPRPLVATVHSSPTTASSAKSAADYLRAIRRRIWLVLIIAIPLATTGTLMVLRLPAIYQVTARIEVKQPHVDSNIDSMVGHGSSSRSEGSDEKYVPNAIALLTSKNLIKEIIRDPALGLPASALEGDPESDLINALKLKPYDRSNQYIITFDGRDPDRITKTLNLLLNRFKNRMGDKSLSATNRAKEDALVTLSKHAEELKKIQLDLESLLTDNRSLAPGGKNLSEARYEALTQQLYFQQQQATTISHQAMLEDARPASRDPGDAVRAQKIADLELKRKSMVKRLKNAEGIAKNPSDPSIKHSREDLAMIDADIADLSGNNNGRAEALSPAEVYREIVAESVEGIRSLEGQREQAMVEMREGMPAYHKYMTLMEDRSNKTKQITELKQRISEFDLLTKSRNEPVEIIDQAFEPIVPVKPNRMIYTCACIVFSFGLGLALAAISFGTTGLVSVPCHDRLALGFSDTILQRLVRTNWLRVASWTIHAAILVGITAVRIRLGRGA